MIIDIILILIVALATFIGYKKGFIKVIIKLGTFVVAIVLAFLLQSSVADFLGNKVGLNSSISNTVEEKLIDITDRDEEKQEDKNIDIKYLDGIIGNINDAAESEKEGIIEKSSNNITTFIIRGISFIIIFSVVSIVMGIIGIILNTVVQLPVLKTLNEALGAGTEFILIVLKLLVLLAIISFMSPLEVLDPLINYINQSCITKWLYENNIIISIIGKDLL